MKEMYDSYEFLESKGLTEYPDDNLRYQGGLHQWSSKK